ncbi:MAG: hypothetical protein ABSG57_04815 [Candidatus Bathyarchaeia archaeon]
MTETELNADDRELVRQELYWIACYLRKNYHALTPWIRKQLHEMISVSV